MKKEIKSYEELLKCDGMKFEGNFEGEEMKGVVIVCSDKYVKLQYDIENKQYQYYLIITYIRLNINTHCTKCKFTFFY